jgi:hypothetical protein
MLDPHTSEWYASTSEGHQDGPLSLQQMAAKWTDDWAESAWVWREGMPEWVPLTGLPDVLSALEDLMALTLEEAEAEVAAVAEDASEDPTVPAAAEEQLPAVSPPESPLMSPTSAYLFAPELEPSSPTPAPPSEAIPDTPKAVSSPTEGLSPRSAAKVQFDLNDLQLDDEDEVPSPRP